VTKILAWQDKETRRRMFDGSQWFDVEKGEVVIVIIGKDLDARVLAAFGVPPESEPSK
jgi:hypothetical protein